MAPILSRVRGGKVNGGTPLAVERFAPHITHDAHDGGVAISSDPALADRVLVRPELVHDGLADHAAVFEPSRSSSVLNARPWRMGMRMVEKKSGPTRMADVN